MTIEEYLNSEAEYIERMLSEEDDLEASSYLEGKRDAYRDMLEKLSEFEHDITMREVKEFCKKQLDDCEGDEDPCEYCSMAMECSDSDDCRWMECGEIADFLPRDWDVDCIQKVIREAKK